VRIAVIGTGYVGLVSGACFADFGHVVTCVDKDAGKIGALRNGVIPIFEPGLDDLVAKNAQQARLFFETDAAPAVRAADAVFIAVGTPSRRGDGHADLSYVYEAAREIARELDGYTVVITKSTVPIGTGDEVERIIRETRPDADFSVVSNPEFLREGAAIEDFKHPDRIVIGTTDPRASKVMAEVYRPLFLNEAPLLTTSRVSAELTKYAANAFLAMKITFMNEIADLCEQVGADVQEVAASIGKDRRIGEKFLHPGPGYGGSCFPKDTRAMIRIAEDAGYDFSLLRGVIAVNDEQFERVTEKVARCVGGELDGVRILSRKTVEYMTTDHTGGVRGPAYLPGAGYGFGLGVAVHSSGELGIQLATMLHLGAVVPNLGYAADAHYHHLADDVIEGGKMKYVDGAIAVPSAPGLGVGPL